MVQKTKTSVLHVCTQQEEASKRDQKREDDSATFLNTGGQSNGGGLAKSQVQQKSVARGIRDISLG